MSEPCTVVICAGEDVTVVDGKGVDLIKGLEVVEVRSQDFWS